MCGRKARASCFQREMPMVRLASLEGQGGAVAAEKKFGGPVESESMPRRSGCVSRVFLSLFSH